MRRCEARSVRRALNLQSGVRHSAPEHLCTRSGEVPPRALTSGAAPASRAGPSALLSRSADWQVLPPALTSPRLALAQSAAFPLGRRWQSLSYHTHPLFVAESPYPAVSM